MIWSVGVSFGGTFNRTSMELKRISPGDDCNVPYPFNRTSMELKLGPTPSTALLNMLSFNRTSMELKLTIGERIRQYREPFNRTSMELKLNHGEHHANRFCLLIEPVWN